VLIGGIEMLDFFKSINFETKVVLLILLLSLLSYKLNRYNIIQSGRVGEKKARKVLESLNSDYTVLSNVRITFNNKSNEVDNIVVGPTGIFIIEVKNHNGTIVGNEKDYEFVQHKVGRKGGNYSKKMYSPIKQVNKQVYILSQILKYNGIKHWIEGIVLFTNPEVNLRINSNKTKVIKLNNEKKINLLKIIESFTAKRQLGKKDCESIVEIIKKYSKRR